jgi:hypothetical protein
MAAIHRKAWIPGQARNDGAKRVRGFRDERRVAGADFLRIPLRITFAVRNPLPVVLERRNGAKPLVRFQELQS